MTSAGCGQTSIFQYFAGYLGKIKVAGVTENLQIIKKKMSKDPDLKGEKLM